MATKTIDLAASEWAHGPRIALLQVQRITTNGSGDEYVSDGEVGFDELGELLVAAHIAVATGTAAPHLTLIVEHRDTEMDSWETAASFDITERGRTEIATIANPKARLRARWEVTGTSPRFTVTALYVTPAFGIEQDSGGGSMPAPEVAAVFASVPAPEQGATSAPTLAEIDTTYNIVEWRPDFDYTLAFAYNGDALFVTLPAGSANVFAAEISGASTGGVVAITGVDTGTQTFTVADDQTRLFPADSECWVTGSTGNDRRYTVVSSAFDTDHTDIVVVQAIADNTADGSLVSAVGPDWDSEAPNLGDSLSDGDVTWYNIGTQAAWPPAPVTWEADTEYAAGTLVWPTVPNGHVYMVYPPGPYTAATEPDPWPDRGAYVAGDSGYLYDMGTKLVTDYAGQYVTVDGVTADFVNQSGLARILIQMRDRLGYVPGIMVETSENGWDFLAVTNSTFIESHPDAASPPLRWQCTENAIVELFHRSLNSEPTSPFQFLSDNLMAFRADLGVLFASGVLAADAALNSGDVAIHGDDAAGLQIKFKTSGGVIKTATIPWD